MIEDAYAARDRCAASRGINENDDGIGTKKEYLPQIEVVTIPHMMHGEYVMMHPKKFTAQALAFFDQASHTVS